jgi:hypothetical protein
MRIIVWAYALYMFLVSSPQVLSLQDEVTLVFMYRILCARARACKGACITYVMCVI